MKSIPAKQGLEQTRQGQSRSRKRLFFWVILLTFGISFTAGFLSESHSNASANIQEKLSLPELAVNGIKNAFVQSPSLQGQKDGRTNIVFYGMTKDGMRTDSIILASYYWQDGKLATINIPRDLYIYDGYEMAKMGEVYGNAKLREPKTTQPPEQFVANLLSKEYGIPIQYWVKFNMQGEVQLVDAIGGIDINVPDAFTDYEYPTWNYDGYIRPAPHFDVGFQHMNGDRALIYSRSRHSLNNNEGSDFARSRRQTIVLRAVMDKVKAQGLIVNIGQISHYLQILGNNVDTNMSTEEMLSFAKMLTHLDEQHDYTAGNWTTGNGFLCSSTSGVGAYIILYGIENSCHVIAGTKQAASSGYAAFAKYYIQHLKESVAYPTSADFLSAAQLGLSGGTKKYAPIFSDYGIPNSPSTN